MIYFMCLKKSRYLVFACLSIITVSYVQSLAQVRPVYDRGATGLIQALKRLETTGSVLMIGAHPDDEDTALLAYLARGEHARTGYLSLTRGDGGQNIIGSELGESLGLIRTEELLQARRLDGAEQFFARAYDYGFSKTLAEAKSKWDEEIVLCDAVRVIRNFRPLVVVAQFSGTPADGHGQHQFAGYIAPLAVAAAADGSRCVDAGPAWQVKKVYARHRTQGDPRLRINTGQYDATLGRSYFEIAMEARSQHKSQEQGVLELKGEQFSGLNLSGSELTEQSILQGLDISVKGAAGLSGNTEPQFVELSRKLQDSITSANARDTKDAGGILKDLAAGYKLAYDAEWSTRNPASKALMKRKQIELSDAIRLAAGIQIDAIADRETVAPGETFQVAVRTFLGNKADVKVGLIALGAPDGWELAIAEPVRETQQQGFFRRETGDASKLFSVTVPMDARPTQPYWLVELRDGDLFRWGTEARTMPFQESAPRASVTVEIAGTKITFEVPVEYRFADDVRGEIRRNVDVVPAVSTDLDQTLMIVPYSEKPQTRAIAMSVVSHSTKAVRGNAMLKVVGDGSWKIAPASKPFELSRKGEQISIPFEVTIPARAKQGSYKIEAVADIGAGSTPPSMKLIAYPHIQSHRYYRPAAADLRLIDLKTSAVKVGYIQGSGDRVPDAIRQMGFNLETVSPAQLANGDLSKYDTILVGIRAFQVRPDVVANNKRLIEFANNGGTLIVQYQLPAYAQQNLTPFPAQMGPRVSDENAEVKVLQPDHAILNFPNKITDTDFKGWVQERNLYNFSTMDAKYVGIFESHDAGEAENSGGLVVADIGKGKYVYCSYSLFRQLPAGVPGAYRLLANMLSLPAKK